jgi:CubicO group peptidase (beta-lactamase class C family)
MMIAEIDAIMNAEVKPDGPGAAIAVVKDGSVVHRSGYGLANVEWNIPIQPDTIFRLASITKQFTAVAIMILAEQGKLRIDDPITKFLPNYPTSGHHVTVHHLLTHTSGIFSYTSDPDVLNKLLLDKTPQEISDSFSRIPFDFKPGAKFLYNNSGYILLGMIIEKLSGLSYADFIQKHIFDPSGMKNSYYLSNEPIIPRRASGYDQGPGGIQNARYLSMTQPHAAGALGSTVDDLVLWNQALTENRLISAEALAQMHTSAVLDDGTLIDYGYGWGISAYQQRRAIHHGGGIFGFATFIARFPHDALSIVVLTNYSGFDSSKITGMIARRMLGLPEVKHTPIELSADDLKKYAGTYRMERFPQPIAVVVEPDGKIILNDGRPAPIVPMSRTEFYVPDNPEKTITFSDEQNGLFTKMTLNLPFEGEIIVLRVAEEEDHA